MRILISAEVEEEICEIQSLLEAVPFDIEQLLIVGEDLEEVFSETRSFTDVGVLKEARFGQLFAKSVALAQFHAIAARAKPDLMISGFSMLKHRLFSYLSGVPHVAYLRGLLVDPNNRSGVSDWIEESRVGGMFPGKITKSFGADRILTLGKANLRFLVERGIDEKSIYQTGPVWLRTIPPAKKASLGVGRRIVLTSALDAHGYHDKHRLQTETLGSLAESAGFSFVLRVHPRDYYDYHSDIRFRNVTIDQSSPESFLRSLTAEDILISPRSTLALEAAYLGAGVIHYCLGDAADRAIEDGWYRAKPLSPSMLTGTPTFDNSEAAALLGTIDDLALLKAMGDIGRSRVN